MHTKIVLVFSLCCSLFLAGMVCLAEAGAEPPVFSTWEDFEADKCASIWLIKRFIDTKATVKFFPRGQIIEEGIPFDTPDAKFRRYHNMSTFESLIKHYDIKDNRVGNIAKFIHDIEVNVWERKRFQETFVVQDAIDKIIKESSNPSEIVTKCCEYFDSLYRTMNSE